MKNKITSVILIILLLLLILSLVKNALNFQKKTTLYDQSQTEKQQLVEENKKLKSQLKKSQDPAFAEKEIRNKLNLLKPNEVAVIIPEITIVPTPSPTSIIPAYQQWIRLFLK